MVEEDSQFQPGASICTCTCTGVCVPPHVPTHVHTCTDTHHTYPCKWKQKNCGSCIPRSGHCSKIQPCHWLYLSSFRREQLGFSQTVQAGGKGRPLKLWRICAVFIKKLPHRCKRKHDSSKPELAASSQFNRIAVSAS